MVASKDSRAQSLEPSVDLALSPKPELIADELIPPGDEVSVAALDETKTSFDEVKGATSRAVPYYCVGSRATRARDDADRASDVVDDTESTISDDEGKSQTDDRTQDANALPGVDIPYEHDLGPRTAWDGYEHLIARYPDKDITWEQYRAAVAYVWTLTRSDLAIGNVPSTIFSPPSDRYDTVETMSDHVTNKVNREIDDEGNGAGNHRGEINNIDATGQFYIVEYIV
ncbi:MAG: hypothetical protein M1833_001358 [Piccolia ochrophora]|nr:MAG: hypothetical protein M1833_001358 [Piccolia ochrophora]